MTTWRKIEVGGVSHSILTGHTWEAHVCLVPESGLYGWKVLNVSTKEIHPRGFGHTGTEGEAMSKGEVLVRNLDRESCLGPGKDQVRAEKLRRGRAVETHVLPRRTPKEGS